MPAVTPRDESASHPDVRGGHAASCTLHCRDVRGRQLARNVYPYVRYPRWIDWAMFGVLVTLAVTLTAGFVLVITILVRDR